MKDFLEFAAERYSVRKYQPTPVEDEKIAAILQSAKLAPTARNAQPQKIYVVKSEEKRKALATATPCTFNAPVIFVVCYEEERNSRGKVCEGHSFGDTDCAIVCTHMMLEAHELGLGSCWVGYFAESDVKAALGLPENMRVRDLLPVGYPAADSVPSPMHTAFREDSELFAVL